MKFKVSFNSPVILGFVAVCFVVMILDFVTMGGITKQLFMTYRAPFTDPLMYVRLLGHALGHSGWDHYIGNMSYILLIGPMLEEKYGSKKILLVMAVTALVTGVLNNLLFPNTALCGASGIVFAFILLTSFAGFKEGEIPLTLILVAVIFIGQQVYEGLFVSDNISNSGHIIGGIVGAVSGYLMNTEHS